MSFVFFVTTCITSTSVKVVYYVKTCILYDLYIFKFFFLGGGDMCFSIQGIGIMELVYVFFFILKLEMSFVDHCNSSLLKIYFGNSLFYYENIYIQC